MHFYCVLGNRHHLSVDFFFLSFSIAVTIVAHHISSRCAAFVSAWKYSFTDSNGLVVALAALG